MKTHKHLIYVLSVTFALILVSILVNVTKRVSFIEDFLNSNIAHNQKGPPKSQDTKGDSNKLTTQFNNYYSTNPINKNDLVKVAALTQGSEIRIYAAGFNALNPTPTNSPTRKIGGEHPKLTLLINDKPVLTAAIIARRTTYDTNAEEYPELQQIVYYSDKKVKFSQIKVRFDNDIWDQDHNVSRDLLVDRVVIDGKAAYTKSQTVTSTGTWNTATRLCGNGDTAVLKPWLNCNGYFKFSDIPQEVIAPTYAPPAMPEFGTSPADATDETPYEATLGQPPIAPTSSPGNQVPTAAPNEVVPTAAP